MSTGGERLWRTARLWFQNRAPGEFRNNGSQR